LKPEPEAIQVRRIEQLALSFRPQPWRFAEERRSEIDMYFAKCKNEKPHLWNGQILLMRDCRFAGGVLSGEYFETDFASFLAWRDWQFPDRSVYDCFAQAALRGADGAFLLGVMGEHTANAGRAYFPSGTPDLDDVFGDRVNLEANVLRELAEETGLRSVDLSMQPGWHGVFAGPRIAVAKIMMSGESATALKSRILCNIERQTHPELCDVRIVRDPADVDANMPDFVVALLEHIWLTESRTEKVDDEI
jgi:hypothetical protein